MRWFSTFSGTKCSKETKIIRPVNMVNLTRQIIEEYIKVARRDVGLYESFLFFVLKRTEQWAHINNYFQTSVFITIIRFTRSASIYLEIFETANEWNSRPILFLLTFSMPWCRPKIWQGGCIRFIWNHWNLQIYWSSRFVYTMLHTECNG